MHNCSTSSYVADMCASELEGRTVSNAKVLHGGAVQFMLLFSYMVLHYSLNCRHLLSDLFSD